MGTHLTITLNNRKRIVALEKKIMALEEHIKIIQKDILILSEGSGVSLT